MRRLVERVETHVVVGAVPQVGLVGDEVVHLERVRGIDAERAEVERDGALLPVVRVEVDDREDRVAVR